MKKYNVFEDKGIDVSRIRDETSCSIFKESSSFLRGQVCSSARTRMGFSFIVRAPCDEVRAFFVVVTRRRFGSIFYGYDSTAFCIVRFRGELRAGVRYILYGRLSRLRTYFIDCLAAEQIDYRDLCRWLL